MLSVLLGDILFLNIKNWGLSRQCHFMSILSSSFCENAEAIPAWLAMDWQIIRKTWRSDTDCFTGNSLISFGGSKSLIPTNGCFTLNSELHKVCSCWLIRPQRRQCVAEETAHALRFKLKRTDPQAHTRLVPIMPMMDKT